MFPHAWGSSRHHYALIVVFLLLAGCAGQTQHPAQITPRPAAGRITMFSLDGRIAVRQGESRYSASISWEHDPGHDTILISGPFGQGLAELIRNDAGARLTLSDHSEFVASDLEQLSSKVFGFTVPLSSMARWTLGDAPGGETTQRDSFGRPRRLAAEGWTIDLVERESDDGNALPVLLDLRRDDLDVRLKVLEWQNVR